MKKSILIGFILILTGFLLGGVVVYHFTTKPSQIERIVVRDTVVQTDTISYTKIVKQDKYHYDTIVINDTVYIRDIPQTYTDSCEDYRLDINAVKLYDYTLDIYKVDTFFKEIEKVPQIERKSGFKKNIGVGLMGGYGLGIQSRQFEPFVGVGVVFSFGYSW